MRFNGKIGMVFQAFNLIPTLTAQENVEVPLLCWQAQGRTFGSRQRVAGSGGSLRRLGHRPNQLSGGERRASGYRSCVGDRPPAFVIADEPRQRMRRMARYIRGIDSLLRAQTGKTFIIATRDPDVASHADRSIRIVDGKIAELDARRGDSKLNESLNDLIHVAVAISWGATDRAGDILVAVGVMAIVALQLVGRMINHSFTRVMCAMRTAVTSLSTPLISHLSRATWRSFDNLESQGAVSGYAAVINTSGSTGVAASATNSFNVILLIPARSHLSRHRHSQIHRNGSLSSLLTNDQVVIDQNVADQYNKKVRNSFCGACEFARNSAAIILNVKVAGIVVIQGCLRSRTTFSSFLKLIIRRL